MNADLNAIRQFIKVADNRSFTLAAAQLGMTQSGISRAVSRLETQLGVKLLHRNTRSLSLTADGELFLTRVRPLITGLSDAQHEMQHHGNAPKGSLKISAPSAFGRLILIPIVSDLLAAHPQLNIELVLTDRTVDIIEEGFDAVIRSGPVADARVIAKKLAPASWVTVASAKYLARRGVPQSIDALSQHNCLRVRLSATGQMNPWRFTENGKCISLDVGGNLILDHGDPLADAAITGTGIAQLLTFFVRPYLADGRLQEVLSQYAPPPQPITLLYPPSRQYSAKLTVFREALIAHWGDHTAGTPFNTSL
ncbi:LysR family transcriptional regulator [Photobacterium galatheae]|uniref:LysR family transcriptional regulator n=1 Tax=Photobacterium galatheae TaxID=1654360 RepID=UPI00202CFFD9|nr:LysR family transcriptional regulator [Photobacterium galatheae]MCM0147185.1 LysR family transcriptional regulator [Photobacterium galatheae]